MDPDKCIYSKNYPCLKGYCKCQVTGQVLGYTCRNYSGSRCKYYKKSLVVRFLEFIHNLFFCKKCKHEYTYQYSKHYSGSEVIIYACKKCQKKKFFVWR